MTRSVEIPEAALAKATEAVKNRMLESGSFGDAAQEAIEAALPYLAPAGDGGLREALEKLAAQWADQPNDYSSEDTQQQIGDGHTLRNLLAAHPAAPAVPEPASEDAAFVLRPKNSAPVADWKRLDACAAASAQMIQWHAPETAAVLIESAVPQPMGETCDHASMAWDDHGTFLGAPLYTCRECGGLFVVSNDGTRIPYRRASAAAVPQPVDREALAKALRACICASLPRPTCPLHGDEYARADAVLAVLAGEQEQVEP